MDRLKNLMAQANQIGNIPKQNIEQTVSLMKQRDESLEKSKKNEFAYYILLGTPWIRSIVKKLSQDYTIDSMTIEQEITPDLSLPPSYKVGLSIKRIEKAW